MTGCSLQHEKPNMNLFKNKGKKQYLDRFRVDHAIFDDLCQRKHEIEQNLDAILAEPLKQACLIKDSHDAIARWTPLLRRYDAADIDEFMPGLGIDLESISRIEKTYAKAQSAAENAYNRTFDDLISNAQKYLAEKDRESLSETQDALELLTENARELHTVLVLPRIHVHDNKSQRRTALIETFHQLFDTYRESWQTIDKYDLELLTRKTAELPESLVNAEEFLFALDAKHLAYLAQEHISLWDSILQGKQTTQKYIRSLRAAMNRKDRPTEFELSFALYNELCAIEETKPNLPENRFFIDEITAIDDMSQQFHAQITGLRTELWNEAQQEIISAKKILGDKKAYASDESYIHDLKNSAVLRNASLYAELGIDVKPLAKKLEETVSSMMQPEGKRPDIPLLERHIYYDRTAPKFDPLCYFLQNEPATDDGKKMSGILLGAYHDTTWQDKMLSLKEAIDNLPEEAKQSDIKDLQTVYTGIFESARRGNLGRSMRGDNHLHTLTELVIRKLYSYLEYQGGKNVTSACTA